MTDALTPKRIENAVFAISDRGYDPGEVETFLKRVAAHVEALAAGVAEFGVKPYEQFGIEMGDLLQHAHDAAEHLRKEAENEAAVILQEADKAARHMRDEAASLKREAESEAREIRSEADRMREEAEETARRLKEQAEHFRNLAEAEASLQRQELGK
jgi:DivIVA domain-containing protein